MASMGRGFWRFVGALLALFCGLSIASQSLAQGTAPGVNKYLVANPPLVPTSATTFTNVTSPETATAYTYVIDVFYNGTAPLTIGDLLPAGFVATGCTVYVNYTVQAVAGCPTSGTPATAIGPFTPAGSAPHRVLVYIAGSFTVGGLKLNQASASGGGLTGTGEVSQYVNTQPPSFDLVVTKTANQTAVPFGTAIVYTTKVTNNSSADVPLAGILTLFDRMENQSASNEYALTWGWLNCTATPGSTCFAPPLPQASAPTLLGPGEAVDVFSTSTTSTTGIPIDPGQSSGVLKIGGSITVTYYAQIESNDPCAPTPPTFRNTSYLGLGSGTGNFPDANPANNTASASVTLTGLPTACPPPPVKITKTLLTTSPAWGAPLTYQVTVTNMSGYKLKFSYEDKVAGAPATTVFSATLGTQSCIPSTCMHTSYSPVTWIGSSAKKLFERTPSAGTISLLAGGSYSITYTVTYQATCSIDGKPVNIRNDFIARGTVLAPTPYNFTARRSHLGTLPPLPVCDMTVKKQWKPLPPVNPSTPLSFGVPIGTYEVAWINNSTVFGMQVGSLWDVMHIDSPLYATVPVTYSPPNCSPSTFSSWTNVLASSTGVNVSPAALAWQGAQAIRIQQATFPPGGMIFCSFTVTAQRPLPTDPNCQAQGTPNLWNTALADMDPAYNPNTTPWKSKDVPKRLPWCVNISIQKVPSPAVVLPGDPVNWSIAVTNNGPLPNGPIGVALSDSVPGPLLPLAGAPTCTAASGSTCSLAWLSPILLTSIGNLGVGQTDTVQFTSTSPQVVTSVKNTAFGVAPIGGGFYYHPRPQPQGSGTVSTAWPTLTKAFSPSTAFGAQTGVTLTFTITNLAYKPAVGGMSFHEKLPLGIKVGPALSNSCIGPVQVTYGASGQPDEVQLNGGAMAAGTASCQFTVPITIIRCGVFSNTNANLVPGSVNHLIPALNASLTVACLKQITGNGIDTPTYKGYGCALYDSGDVKCWGTGALARPPAPPTAVVTTGVALAEKIDASTMHTCTVTKDGRAQCWGGNAGGQLGDGSFANHQSPNGYVKTNATTELTGLVDISAGGNTTCAVDLAGKVWCWGRMAPIAGPYAVAVPSITTAKRVSVSTSHICALLSSGKAECWGLQLGGALGNFNPAAATIMVPTTVLASNTPPIALGGIRTIKAGVNYTCALMGTTPSRVRCWGRNDTAGGITVSNALGTGSTAANVLAPSLVASVIDVRNLTVTDSPSGQLHNCVTRNLTRQVLCWGSNINQQIGSGPPSPWKAPTIGPVLIHPSGTVTGPIDASNGKTCAIVGAGPTPLNAFVQCWGSRALGMQLGDALASPATTATPLNLIGIP